MLRAFECRVLRKIFGLKRDEVAGEWRRLQNEEINERYSSQSIFRAIKSRIMVLAGHIACTGERGDAYRVLVGKPEVQRPLGTIRNRWEANIKMDLQEV